MDRLPGALRVLAETARDVLPLVVVVTFFYGVVLGAAPADPARVAVGGILVVAGLAMFVRGLALSLFPLGEGLADAMARRGNLMLLLAFAFAIGFGSTVAEPALYAVASKAAAAGMAAGQVAGGEAAVATALRYAVSAAVGIAVAVGCLRIVLGWPAWWFLLSGYVLVAVLGLVRGTALLGVAFDAGAAATSAINIPLIAALGIGLASSIRGRRPLVDGFGVVALASVMPMLVVILAALVVS